MNAEEIYERLSDRFTAAELIEVLGVTTSDLKDMGLIGFIDENLEGLTSILSILGILNDSE